MQFTQYATRLVLSSVVLAAAPTLVLTKTTSSSTKKATVTITIPSGGSRSTSVISGYISPTQETFGPISITILTSNKCHGLVAEG